MPPWRQIGIAMITTIENTTIETTTTHRTHWVEPGTGLRYETLWARGEDGRHFKREGLRPVLNLDEVREYVALGLEHLPPDPSVPPIALPLPGGAIYVGAANSVWYAHQVLTGAGSGRTEHVLTKMAEELTDDVPRYHEQWRAPFVASRERFAAPPAPYSA
jgi:hypothetical protein